MSGNVKKCADCDSTSMEICLRRRCKYWTAGSHLDHDEKQGEKMETNHNAQD